MNMKKDPKTLADDLIRQTERQLAAGREMVGPGAIGRHVLAILSRGETLTAEALCQSLEKEATDLGASSKDRDLSAWAAERIRSLMDRPA